MQVSLSLIKLSLKTNLLHKGCSKQNVASHTHTQTHTNMLSHTAPIFASEGKAAYTEVFANWRDTLKEPSGAASSSASVNLIGYEKCTGNALFCVAKLALMLTA